MNWPLRSQCCVYRSAGPAVVTKSTSRVQAAVKIYLHTLRLSLKILTDEPHWRGTKPHTPAITHCTNQRSGRVSPHHQVLVTLRRVLIFAHDLITSLNVSPKCNLVWEVPASFKGPGFPGLRISFPLREVQQYVCS